MSNPYSIAALYDDYPNMVAISDENGAIFYMNKANRKAIGLPLDFEFSNSTIQHSILIDDSLYLSNVEQNKRVLSEDIALKALVIDKGMSGIECYISEKQPVMFKNQLQVLTHTYAADERVFFASIIHSYVIGKPAPIFQRWPFDFDVDEKSECILYFLCWGYSKQSIANNLDLTYRQVEYRIDKLKELFTRNGFRCESLTQLSSICRLKGFGNLPPRALLPIVGSVVIAESKNYLKLGPYVD